MDKHDLYSTNTQETIKNSGVLMHLCRAERNQTEFGTHKENNQKVGY